LRRPQGDGLSGIVHSSFHFLSWFLNDLFDWNSVWPGFGITALLLFGGSVGDIYGRRRTFIYRGVYRG